MTTCSSCGKENKTTSQMKTHRKCRKRKVRLKKLARELKKHFKIGKPKLESIICLGH